LWLYPKWLIARLYQLARGLVISSSRADVMRAKDVEHWLLNH
jgi:hypothetical protein